MRLVCFINKSALSGYNTEPGKAANMGLAVVTVLMVVVAVVVAGLSS